MIYDRNFTSFDMLSAQAKGIELGGTNVKQNTNLKRRFSIRNSLNKLASIETFMKLGASGSGQENFVINEKVEEEDKASNLDLTKVSDEIPDFSPLSHAKVADGPTPTSGTNYSGSHTSKHLKVTSQPSSGGKPKPTLANMKRTKSEFVTRDFRRTHAKDMGAPKQAPQEKI